MPSADENYVVCNFESDTAKPDLSLALILFLLYEAVPLSRFQSKQEFLSVTKTDKINT